jgi:hypothetical protein
MKIMNDTITLSLNLEELVLFRDGLLALKERGLPCWFGYAARACETGACQEDGPHDCRGNDQKLLDVLDGYLTQSTKPGSELALRPPTKKANNEWKELLIPESEQI